jgi:hypothetical protein
MTTTSYEPAGGSPTVRARSAAALHPARPDSKPSRLQAVIEAVNHANDPAEQRDLLWALPAAPDTTTIAGR